MSDIRYTTRPDGPTLSRSRAQVDEVLVIVPAPAVRAASPAARQHIAAAAGIPARVALALAGRDLPVVVARARNAGDATRAAARFREASGAGAEVLAAGPSAWGAPAAAAAGAVVAAGAGFLINSLGFLIALVLLLAAVFLGARALKPPSDDAARESMQAAADATAAHPEAWAALASLRAKSLDADLPVQAQVDLWTAIERAEEDLATGRATPEVTIAAARGALDDLQAPLRDAPDLARTAAAARRSVRDLEP